MDQNSYSRKLCIKQANNNLQAEIYVVNVQVQIWHIEKKSITHHTSCFKRETMHKTSDLPAENKGNERVHMEKRTYHHRSHILFKKANYASNKKIVQLTG